MPWAPARGCRGPQCAPPERARTDSALSWATAACCRPRDARRDAMRRPHAARSGCAGRPSSGEADPRRAELSACIAGQPCKLGLGTLQSKRASWGGAATSCMARPICCCGLSHSSPTASRLRSPPASHWPCQHVHWSACTPGKLLSQVRHPTLAGAVSVSVGRLSPHVASSPAAAQACFSTSSSHLTLRVVAMWCVRRTAAWPPTHTHGKRRNERKPPPLKGEGRGQGAGGRSRGEKSIL